MTELDHRTKSLVDKIKKNAQDYRDSRKLSERTLIYKDIMSAFDTARDYADDKIQLAYQTYDLVDKHIRRLDGELARIDKECRERQVNLQDPSASSGGGGGGGGGGKSSHYMSSGRDHHSSVANNQDSNHTSSQSSSNRHKGKKRPRSSKNSNEFNGDSDDCDTYASPSKKGKLGKKNKSSSKKSKHKHEETTSTKDPSAASNISNLPAILTGPGEPLAVDMPIDPNEPLYCTCHQVSHGEMIACDNKECPIEWFHFACVNLVEKPKGRWYCNECYTNYNKNKGNKSSKKKRHS